MRSASVDLPWSTWAMMEKLRMFRIASGGMERRRHGRRRPAGTRHYRMTAGTVARPPACTAPAAARGRPRRTAAACRHSVAVAPRRHRHELACRRRARTSSITVCPGLTSRQLRGRARPTLPTGLRPTCRITSPGCRPASRAASAVDAGDAARLRPASGPAGCAVVGVEVLADQAERIGRRRRPAPAIRACIRRLRCARQRLGRARRG